MEYPRLKPEENPLIKLLPFQIKKVRELYKNGHSLRWLGKKFNVSYSAIYYHVNDNRKEYMKNLAIKITNKKLKNPLYRKKVRENRSKNIVERYNNDAEFLKYRRFSSRRYKFNLLTQYKV